MANQKKDRTGEERLNNQGCLMKIIKYNNRHDIIVEFQDEYKARVHGQYVKFLNGNIRNPYFPSVFDAGATGIKYPVKIENEITKEYAAWHSMIQRCYDEKYKNKKPSYKNVTCCDEWLLYENFYEWLHSQDNFEKWLDGKQWNVDKDILIKGNKIYSPETCCLVPNNINKLFTKCDASRGNLPIGVSMDKETGAYKSACMNPVIGKLKYLGRYETPLMSFYAYKFYKENLIKQVAQIEYDKGNITKQCYEAMLSYEVEITD